jgi:hypothetical protein
VPAPGNSTGTAYNAGSNSGTTYTELLNPKLAHPTYAEYFNTSAFQANPSFTLATTGPYLNIRELVHPLTDVSVFKRFILHESTSFELRGEFFNVLNTPNFGAPGTTPGTSAYGVVTKTQVNDPRLTQLTARINF